METKQRAAATDRCATPRNIPPRGLPRLVVEVCQRGDRGVELRDMARHGFVSLYPTPPYHIPTPLPGPPRRPTATTHAPVGLDRENKQVNEVLME